MKTYTIINDRYSNETAEVTMEQLQEMYPDNEYRIESSASWSAGFDEAIMDDRNEVVAIETEAYNSYEA